MPDWLAYVNSHLGRLPLSQEGSLQVREELAAHLEDAYVFSWHKAFLNQTPFVLSANRFPVGRIFTAISSRLNRRPSCENRVTQLWVPGLVTLLSAYAL